MVTDANGCVSLTPGSVTITVTPQGELAVGPDTTVFKGQPVQLTAIDLNGSGFTSYAWSPATGLNNPAIENPTANPEETITYIVEALTPGGCKGSGSVTITVAITMDIYVPSGFTPNGDGNNDVLRAIPRGIRDFKYFAVYSRWGQLIFRTTDPSKGWDGSIQGQPQASGVFVWMAAGIDLQGKLIERKGTTVLIR
jgi:gliding motility-associated-like protein